MGMIARSTVGPSTAVVSCVANNYLKTLLLVIVSARMFFCLLGESQIEAGTGSLRLRRVGAYDDQTCCRGPACTAQWRGDSAMLC